MVEISRFFLGLGCLAAALSTLSAPVSAAETIPIQYITREVTPPPTLSNLDPFEPDVGQQGVVLGVEDSNTTGRFLGQVFELSEISIPEDADALETIKAQGGLKGFVIANLPASDLLTVADSAKESGALIFNAAAPDNALRNDECRGNVVHTLPSWSMLTDALAQFSLSKRWNEWLLLAGPTDADAQFSASLKQSAKKFGIKIVEEVNWDSTSDLRRNAHEEIPRMTNGSDYDLVAVADESGDFGRYVPFNTYLPRPVIGSAGLEALGWSRVVEQWGAAQLQSRFVEQAGRPMRAVDYAAWAAVRSIAEATARTKKTDTASVRAYLLSEKFQLAAFKGRKMSFRDWNGQLRQPIPLVQPRALVAQAPIEGFIHQVTEMDTLGIDRPTSTCKAFVN